MHYETFGNDSYSGGSVTRNGERLVYCKISVDLHNIHSVYQEAIECVYTDALLAGAGKLSRMEFIDHINLLGADITIGSHNSILTISIKVLKENLPKLLKLIESMFDEPTFALKEIKRIQTQKINQLTEEKEDAKTIAFKNLLNTLYTKKDRRYSEMPDTLKKTVATITKSDLLQFHKRVLAQFWFVTIGGDTDTVSNILTFIEKYRNSNVKTTLSKKEHGKVKISPKVLLQDIPSKQNIEFSIGGTLPITLNHPDYLPFVFGLSVLGKCGGFTGRLMSIIREKEGLTYGIYARTETFKLDEQGYWRIMTFFNPKQAVQGLQSTLREINRIQKKGITQSEYNRFKVIIKTQQDLMSDSLISCIDELHGYVCEKFNLQEILNFKKKLLSIKKSEVNTALSTYFNTNSLVISGAGPIKAVKKDIEQLYGVLQK
jgi:zinc protease